MMVIYLLYYCLLLHIYFYYIFIIIIYLNETNKVFIRRTFYSSNRHVSITGLGGSSNERNRQETQQMFSI